MPTRLQSRWALPFFVHMKGLTLEFNIDKQTNTCPSRAAIRSHATSGITTLALLIFLTAIGPGAKATTKGLNQIVTPDVQPYGQLSISYQEQDPNIGNPTELQIEVGLTRQFEIAVFQGLNPREQILNTELALVQKGPYLLSTGFSNWNSLGGNPQTFLEGGYYKGSLQSMIGVAEVGHQTQSILGLAYQATARVKLQLDYQSGSGNSATAGFTYNFTPQLQFNPAVYLSNARSHPTYGYAVLTWNVQAWK